MSAYIARRILLMLPTLLGILFVSFLVVQFAPGGPVDRVIAQLSGADTGGLSRVSGGGGDFAARGPANAAAVDAVNSKYRGAQGLDPEQAERPGIVGSKADAIVSHQALNLDAETAKEAQDVSSRAANGYWCAQCPHNRSSAIAAPSGSA